MGWIGVYAVDKHRQVFHGILRCLIWGKIISRGKGCFKIVPSTVLLVGRFFEFAAIVWGNPNFQSHPNVKCQSNMELVRLWQYPPTPAFAKAGAAPGTTGGVDPVFLEPLPHPTLQAKATTRPQQWLKSTPLPQQWLLIGVQGCRLPGLKPSKPSKSPPSSAGKRYPDKPNTRHSRTQKPPQGHSNGWRAPPGHSNGSRAPPGRSNGFLYKRSRLPFARPQTLQKSAQLRTEKVPQQAQHAPLPHAKATTRPQQWLKGTPRPQQWL